MKVRAVGLLAAVLLFAGCATSTGSAPTTSTSSSGGVSSLTALRDAAVAAGYNCPAWQQDDESTGECSGVDKFLWFSTRAERDAAYEKMSGWVTKGLAEAVLFGSTWAINGDPHALKPLAAALNGELLVDSDYQATEPDVGVTCEGRGILSRASVRLDDDSLTATFVFASKPPLDSESFGVYIMAANYEKGTGSYQAGVLWVDGTTQGPFIGDLSGNAKQENYPATDVIVDGKRITVKFDSTPFKKLGEGWQWRAAIGADGKDSDSCPGDVDDFLIYP